MFGVWKVEEQHSTDAHRRWAGPDGTKQTQSSPTVQFYIHVHGKTSLPTKIACALTPPAPRQCTPPRLAHSLHRTRPRPHSAIRTRTQHVSCELLAATHTHNTLHYTCTFLHPAHNKRVMIFLDTASTMHTPRTSSHFSYALRASPALFRTRILNREHKWQHLCFLLR